MNRYAVIPTRNRPGDLRDCVAAIAPQVDTVIIIAHDNWVLSSNDSMYVIPYDDFPPNISTMWNHGLNLAHTLAQDKPYFVAVLNDDAIVPSHWFQRVCALMGIEGSAAGSMNIENRMAGYAFILDGTKGIRADERLRWWYGDTRIEDVANARGGVSRIHEQIEHRYPNSTTVGSLREQADIDYITYLGLEPAS